MESAPPENATFGLDQVWAQTLARVLSRNVLGSWSGQVMSIATRTATSAAWQLAAAVGVRSLGLIGTLVVTRFVAPAEFGEVMLASACVIFGIRMVSMGHSAYVIAYRTSPADSFQALLLQVLMVTLSLSLVVVFREPLALALGGPGMSRYVPGLAVAALLAQIPAVPAATLNRDLRFDVSATAAILGEAAYAGTAIALAPVLGPGAIVSGSVARSALTAALVVTRSDAHLWWAPQWPKWSAFKRQLAFTIPLTGTALAETVSSYGDNMLVARLYGPAVMGHYNLSFNVASTPSEYVGQNAADVLLPSFSAMGDADGRRRAFLRALSVLPLLVFPVVFGIAATAPTMVATLLDPRWAPTAPMIAILSGIGMARTIGAVAIPYLLSSRRSSTVLVLGALRATALVALILTLGRLGPLWVCAAATMAALATHAGGLVAVSRMEKIGLVAMLGCFAPALVASLVMVAAVLATRSACSTMLFTPWMALVAEICLGALVYGVAARLLAPRQIDDVVGIVRMIVARARPAFRAS